MWDYFVSHYIELQFGIAFPLTECAYVVGILFLFAPRFRRKRDIARRFIEFLVLWLLMTVGAGLIEQYASWVYKKYILMPVLIVMYAVCCSKLPWDLRAVYGIFYFSVFCSSLTVSSYLGNISGDSAAIRNTVTTGVQILMLMGLTLYIRLCRVEKYSVVPKYCSVLIILIACIHIAAHELLARAENVRFYIETGFILIELVAFHLYYVISKVYDEKTKLNIMRMKQERENYVMEIAHSEIEKLKELRHDMKNHLAFMSYLVKEGRTDEMKEYLEQYSTELYDALQFSLCGNYTIDYILDLEIRRASACGVKIDYKIIVPPQLPYDDKDLCGILTNILDNAIEAASKMEDKTVELKIEWKNELLLISCSNATDRFPEGTIRENIPTSKKNKEVHGYGMKIVRATVKKYNGAVKIAVKDGRFRLSLYLGQRAAEKAPACGGEEADTGTGNAPAGSGEKTEVSV